MKKVSVTGPRNHLQDVIETLHDLELLHIEDYEGELDTGEPFEEAEKLSQTLVDVRSILSKLPETEVKEEDFDLAEVQKELENVREKVSELEDRRESFEKELSSLEEEEGFLRKIAGSGIDYEDLQGTESLDVFVGELDSQKFKREVDTDNYELVEGEEASIVFYYVEDSDEVERTLSEIGASEIEIVEADRSGSIDGLLSDIEQERSEIQEELDSVEGEMEDFSREWRGKLEAAEKFMTEKVEKAEAPLRFATTESTFIAEGYVPASKFEIMEEELIDVTNGSIHVQEEEKGQPPVKHENNALVRPFESLTDLVAVPRYNELDPSFMIFLTFPVMFGFMIGDAGYGLTSGIVFYAAYRMYPEAREIFKSLMYASVATLIFGLAFGDAFGYVIFGHHSELAAVTGIHLFEKIPILFHRAEHLGQVFKIAAAFGVFHVNLGYLLGAYNEYVRHGVKEAFLENGSWIVLEIGAGLWYFMGAAVGAPVVALSVILLYLGEGIEGVVEIPSLLSNILSYLRIFGVSVAAVALAGVVNSMAQPLFAMQSMAGFIGGVAVLMIGHTFNTFIKIMEGFLQGIRLHYVELFTKFFEGGGKIYMPFGKRYFR